MNHREQLELAAKAAGLDGEWADFPGMDIRVGYQGGLYLSGDNDCYWNPREDDSDALRLAVSLHMIVCVVSYVATAQYYLAESDSWITIKETIKNGDDPCAAARHAIVRAAAELGASV